MNPVSGFRHERFTFLSRLLSTQCLLFDEVGSFDERVREDLPVLDAQLLELDHMGGTAGDLDAHRLPVGKLEPRALGHSARWAELHTATDPGIGEAFELDPFHRVPGDLLVQLSRHPEGQSGRGHFQRVPI